MQKYKIETDAMGRELNIHGDAFFPLAVYDKYFTDFVLKEVPWHWHEEVEIVIVYEGKTKVEYVDGSLELSAGEGIFINSNTLHRLTKISLEKCRIKTFVLMPEFIGGRYDSRIYSEYINPICSNRGVSAIKFTPKNTWENNFISEIKMAFEVFEKKEYGYELSMRSNLTKAWTSMVINKRDLLNENILITEDKRRINKITEFIHSNYENNLPVEKLASIASISESECYRLFKRTLGTSPNNYILNYRLQVAAIKLVDTDDSIITITHSLGFGSPSYFSKKFKDQYKMTPKQFRNANHKS